jgi:hypothetical protein
MTEDEARQIKARHREWLMKLTGVHGLSLERDPAGNFRLVILAEGDADLSNLPAEIDNLPIATELAETFRPRSRTA